MTYPPQPPSSGFAQPSSPGGGDTFNASDHNGALLLIYPKNYTDEVQTKNGPSSAAEVDIIVVDRPGPDGRPQFFHAARFFGNLARSVRNDLGGQVLGRLGQGPNTRGTPPWILTNYTDQDAALAGPVHAAYQQGQFKQPQNPMQQQSAAPAQTYAPPSAPAAPPVQQQWNQPPAAPAAPPQQQWSPPAQQAPSAPTQQWSPPPAAPAPAAPPAPEIDPNLLQFLAGHGISLPPGATQEQAVEIANSLPR